MLPRGLRRVGRAQEGRGLPARCPRPCPPCGLQSPREGWRDPWEGQRDPQRFIWVVDPSPHFLLSKRAGKAERLGEETGFLPDGPGGGKITKTLWMDTIRSWKGRVKSQFLTSASGVQTISPETGTVTDDFCLFSKICVCLSFKSTHEQCSIVYVILCTFFG